MSTDHDTSVLKKAMHDKGKYRFRQAGARPDIVIIFAQYVHGKCMWPFVGEAFVVTFP